MRRIVHFSDIHFGAENAAAVEAARDWAAKASPAVTIISGDITQFGHHDEFRAARTFVETLAGPVLVTPGNHDTPYAGLIERAADPFRRFRKAFGPAWAQGADFEGLRVAGFNTARGLQWRLNWSKGAANPEHVRAAARKLSDAPAGVLRVAVCHHPLIEVTGGPMTGKVWGGRRAAQVLSVEGLADVVLSGHVHTAFAHPLPCGDGHTINVGAGTLSLRERGERAGFSVIDWDEEDITVQAQCWTGSHFEASRTWAFPRRRRG